MKLPILGILSLAWFLAGNHCALFAISTAAHEKAKSCCHSKSASSEHKSCDQCCATLAAPIPSSAQAAEPAPGVLVATLPGDSMIPCLESPESDCPLLGASPPGHSFVQFVWGSILGSQAPPLLFS